VYEEGEPQVVRVGVGVAESALVREVPARNFYLVRDRVQGEKRSERRGVELPGVFPFGKNFVA